MKDNGASDVEEMIIYCLVKFSRVVTPEQNYMTCRKRDDNYREETNQARTESTPDTPPSPDTPSPRTAPRTPISPPAPRTATPSWNSIPPSCSQTPTSAPAICTPTPPAANIKTHPPPTRNNSPTQSLAQTPTVRRSRCYCSLTQSPARTGTPRSSPSLRLRTALKDRKKR